MGELKIKRVYGDLSTLIGKRVLVDRVWPRGVKKEGLHLDLWAKDIAPTSTLRKTFNHVVENYPRFKVEYLEELKENSIYPAFLEQIRHWLEEEDVYLLYGAKDEVHNQAIVLKERLLKDLAT